MVFHATNLIPSNLNVDDFQVYTPTDTIGQHIHLVKFDVTSSDGSGNGWNYEDGTLAADEVRERILAHNNTKPAKPLKPRTHRLFLRKGQLGATENGALAGIPAVCAAISRDRRRMITISSVIPGAAHRPRYNAGGPTRC